ncbi:MAG: heavy-metal-associated domain-containing protein [Pseudomonadota bacterium]
MPITLAILATASLALAPQDHAHDHSTAHHQTADTAPVDNVSGRTIKVAVNGMVCDFCARSLTKVLERNNAVEAVDVSLENKTITIVLAEGGVMSDQDIDDAVRNAGYNIASIDRSAS